MKKRILRPAAALALLACFLLPAHAEEFNGSRNWSVTFDGEEMISSFVTNDLKEPIAGLEPGDEVVLSVTLKNEADYATNWYMTNEVLKSLEDGIANGGAYTYILRYLGSGEEMELYNSDAVGGDESQGLLEATDSLKDYFYLDRLEAGDAAKISLEIGLDGETQGNAYQGAQATLQMNFAAEQAAEEPNTDEPAPPTPSAQVSPGPGDGTGGGTNPTATPKPTPGKSLKTSNIKTGDESRLGLWTALLILSTASALLLIVFAVKNRRKDGEAHE